MRMPPLLADIIHARACIPICEKFLTLPICVSRILPIILLLSVIRLIKEQIHAPISILPDRSMECFNKKLIDS